MKSFPITEGKLSHLGSIVEVRSMTVGQYVESQKDIKKAGDDVSTGLIMLGYMLRIDGNPIGWERLCELDMDDVQPALGLLKKVFVDEPEPGEDGAEGEEGNG